MLLVKVSDILRDQADWSFCHSTYLVGPWSHPGSRRAKKTCTSCPRVLRRLIQKTCDPSSAVLGLFFMCQHLCKGPVPLWAVVDANIIKERAEDVNSVPCCFLVFMLSLPSDSPWKVLIPWERSGMKSFLFMQVSKTSYTNCYAFVWKSSQLVARIRRPNT